MINDFIFTLDNNTYTLTDVVNKDIIIADIPSSYNNKLVTKISKKAFRKCEKLLKVIIPSSIETIDEGIFSDSIRLKEIINYSTCSLTNIFSPYSSISLSNVSILSKVDDSRISKDGDYYIYKDDINLITLLLYTGNDVLLSLPSTINIIGFNAFNSSKIEVMIIPSSVSMILEKAFAYSKSLLKVIIPHSVSYIDKGIFLGCKRLLEIINYSNVNITDMLQILGVSSTSRVHLLNSISESNIYLNENTLLYFDPKEVILLSDYNDESTIVVKEGVTSIDDYCFAYNNKITKVVLPSTLKSIGVHAFSYMDELIDINIPKSTEVINSHAFYQSTKLNNITFNSNKLDIMDYAFANCKSLTYVKFYSGINYIGPFAFCNTAISNIELSDGLKSIDKGAFSSNLKLTSCKLPISLESIGDAAFVDTNLAKIIIPNSLCKISEYAFDEKCLITISEENKI